MDVRLSTSEGTILTLGRSLGSGGEAFVHEVVENNTLAAKVYRTPRASDHAKLSAMVISPPHQLPPITTHVGVAWPQNILYSVTTGAFRGFTMNRIANLHPLSGVYNPKSRIREMPRFTWKYLLRAARNLAIQVSKVHEAGHIIGDLNESNVAVLGTAQITLVDADSFQIKTKQSTFRCLVGKPEFTAPEIQGMKFADIDRTIETDNFALGVLLFLLLMEGNHPYSSRTRDIEDVATLDARIRRGWYPHEGSIKFVSPPPYAPSILVLPPQIRALFKRTFLDGHSIPVVRPSAGEWSAALAKAEQLLTECPNNHQHHFSSHLTTCPWCERTVLLNGFDPFPSESDIRNAKHLRNTKIANNSSATIRPTQQRIPAMPHVSFAQNLPAVAKPTVSATTSAQFNSSIKKASRYVVYPLVTGIVIGPVIAILWGRGFGFIDVVAGYLSLAFVSFLSKAILARTDRFNWSKIIPFGKKTRLLADQVVASIPQAQVQTWHASSVSPQISKSASYTSTVSKICKRCGAQMVSRSGRYGQFWGCTNFRVTGCRYTENISRNSVPRRRYRRRRRP